jgi:hypothetical protein
MTDKKKNKNTGLKMIISILVLALLIAVAVLLVMNRDELGTSGIGDFFLGKKSGRAEVLYFETYPDAVFAALGDGMAVASSGGVRYVAANGETLAIENFAMSAPAICSSGKIAVAYEVGGTEMRLFSSGGEMTPISMELPIISVSVSGGGIAVTTQERGFKGAVTVYNKKGEDVYKSYFGSGYVTAAAVSPGAGAMAALSISDAGGKLTLFSLSSETEKSSFIEQDTLFIALTYISDTRIAVLSDSKVCIFNENAKLLSTYSFEGKFLRGFDFGGDGFITLALGEYRLGGTVELVTLNSGGEVIGTAVAAGEMNSLSCAGKYVAALFGDRLEIYKENMKLEMSEQDVVDAKKVLMRSDGTALIVYDYSASLYTP